MLNENRVKNVLGDIEGVEEVKANHETGIVEIKTSKEIEKSRLEEKIEDIGFEVEK